MGYPHVNATQIGCFFGGRGGCNAADRVYACFVNLRRMHTVLVSQLHSTGRMCIVRYMVPHNTARCGAPRAVRALRGALQYNAARYVGGHSV